MLMSCNHVQPIAIIKAPLTLLFKCACEYSAV